LKVPKKETNKEFQERTFPGRIKAVQEKAGAALAADKKVGKGHKPLSAKERGKHQTALKAAGRVGARMGIAPSREAVTKPGKKKGGSTPKSRRRAVEKATGVGPSVTDKLRGINELISAGRKSKNR
jgi:hypothetical protein